MLVADDDLVAEVVRAIGGAAGRSFAKYYRSASVRRRTWDAEQLHALGFVKPEDWDELDLNVLIDRLHESQGSNYPTQLGRQLWIVMDTAQTPQIVTEARRALDIAAQGESISLDAGVETAISSLSKLARPMIRYAREPDVTRLVEHAVALDSSAGEALAARIEAVSRSLVASPRISSPEQSASATGGEVPNLLWAFTGQAEEPADESDTARDEGTHVNVGFVEAHNPQDRITFGTLKTNHLYWFWVGVGPRTEDALDGETETISAEHLEGADEVEVVLFPDEALDVSPAPASGTFDVVEEGAFPVKRSATPVTAEVVGDVANSRLFFGVRTPHRSGEYRIRCGVYVRGLLIHVEQVTVPVGRVRTPLSAKTTFKIAKQFAPAALSTVDEHRLSVYVNADPDGSHTFAFYGRDGELRYSDQANLDGNQVRAVLGDARAAMQLASWVGGGEYTATAESRYEPVSPGDPFATVERLQGDLVALAIAGRRLWLEFTGSLVHKKPDQVDEFTALMQTPGLVQLAPRDDPDLILPLQILYDRPVATGAPKEVSLCTASAKWLAEPAGALPCLEHPCPDMGNELRVCPAGFWGYRHAISVTIARHTECPTSTLPTSIAVSEKPPALVGLTTDEAVTKYVEHHMTRLRELFEVSEESDYAAVTESLKAGTANVVYFLCHVRYEGSVPVIVVGPVDGRGIDAVTLQDLRPDLCKGQPLVFLNACDSAAASPDRLLGLVDHFFRHGASTAVGTEITVFASLAVPFAEHLLTEFAGRAAIGEAIRRARVAMFAAHNPLGLAYIAFGLPQFNLEPAAVA